MAPKTPAPKTSAAKSAPDAKRRSERSRRAIYEAALSMVSEVGYGKVTIEGIAARAGVGKQTIYRWWSSKAEVLLEAFVDLGQQAAEAAGGEDAFAALPDTGDVAADLKTVLRATVDELLDEKYDAPYRALAAEGVVNRELSEKFVQALLEPGLRLYVARIEKAQRDGQIRADLDPRIAMELFVSPLAQRWLQGTGPLTHAYTDTVVDYALHGLAPR
ncbi:TetR/AcrR family transcriptional regulator [Streptomyces indicus]|uniref:DNA-binding transcriptional regulator, AcrR family n=1 Tax=Streptomyces indicus TaxID=417292 RepID=A0A1G8YJP7_9ACTN|nr:TetR/AcrR family transcriptional regulator [Streptomyces indicus]SDK03099.1 DNA-binding transcriptional regulator, AcrR family [Streptomyces indicus]